MGSVHPGEKAYVNAEHTLGCDSAETFAQLMTYAHDNDTERADRELMLTGRCQRLTLNEKVIVTAEVGDLRQATSLARRPAP